MLIFRAKKLKKMQTTFFQKTSITYFQTNNAPAPRLGYVQTWPIKCCDNKAFLYFDKDKQVWLETSQSS